MRRDSVLGCAVLLIVVSGLGAWVTCFVACAMSRTTLAWTSCAATWVAGGLIVGLSRLRLV